MSKPTPLPPPSDPPSPPCNPSLIRGGGGAGGGRSVLRSNLGLLPQSVRSGGGGKGVWIAHAAHGLGPLQGWFPRKELFGPSFLKC